MSKSSIVNSLAKAIADRAQTRAAYVVPGTLPIVDPELVVDGLGRLTFPLKPAVVKGLKSTGQIAPYGKGTRTLIDTSVRNTVELDPSRFQLGSDWNAAVAEAARVAGHELGLNGDLIEAKVYKLLIYEKGGFFLPHRDSEKLDRMVASMIVVLPNPFGGGELAVSHGGQTRRFDFRDSFEFGGPGCRLVAFYSDCEHEVKRVTSGHRICLAYNLMLKTVDRPTVKPVASNPLVAAIDDWVESKPTEPLVFALDHLYTAKGLSKDLLKGADRQLADAVGAAAERADCNLHFAQIQMHDCFSAFDGSEDWNDYSGRRSRRRGKVTIQELIEQELYGEEWTDPTGKKMRWSAISFDPDAIVCDTPLKDWTPTREEYEGYTGNAGNTLDRWYHRTALVLWHRSRQYEILAEHGAIDAMVTLAKLAGQLAKPATKNRERIQLDCLGLARGVVARWPIRWAGLAGTSGRDGYDSLKRFPDLLAALDSRELNAAFLAKLALHDELTPLDTFIPAICERHGSESYAKELIAFFLPRTNTRYAKRTELTLRDVRWLLALSERRSTRNGSAVHRNALCEAAVNLFCSRESDSRYGRSEDSTARPVLSTLLKTLFLNERHELADRVIRTVRGWPKRFPNDTGQVPALVELVPWCRERFQTVPPSVRDWLESIREQLTTATRSRPAPPGDWARPANVNCQCAWCATVSTFLANPLEERFELRAGEYDRSHVERQIAQERLDLKGTLSKVSRPYALVLTKTIGSYERALKQYEVDCGLLQELPAVSDG